MTRHDPIVRLRHMRDYALEAIQMLGDASVEQLHADRKLQLALIQLIEIVGEAASRIPADVRLLHPAISWQSAANMRNRLIHGYDLIDYEIVFGTVKTDLPALVKQLDVILSP